MRYQFKRQDALDFAAYIGQRTKIRGEEMQVCYCPYCKGGRNRDDYTFSINLKTGLFKCLRSQCGQQGNMWRLAQDFDFKLSDEFSRYYEKKSQYRKLPQPKEKIVPKPKAIEYLASRGISEETAKAYQITVQSNNENVLVFPVYDENGTMVNVKYRNTEYNKAEKNGSKEWFEPNCKPYIYGLQTFNGDFSCFTLSEGQLDCASLHEAGVENAFSVLGGKGSFTWFPACYDFLSKFKSVIIFGDYENGKITLLDDMRKRLECKIMHIREEDYKDCKDANDILRKYGKDYLKEIVGRAVAVPMKQVIELADVEDVDPFSLTKVESGIDKLDRLLYGGLPLGAVVNISGKSGVGKSNLASQILVHAISQGYVCFAYSGELPNYLFKAWMDFQIAGRKHVTTYQNKWGDENYTISKANKQLITNWYRGRCFIHDSSIVDGEEIETLTEVIVGAIKQYGVQVILIDNLMTAIGSSVPGKDKYEKQSEFCRQLADIAKKWNVLILLVAHKRKGSFIESADLNDDTSGTADITNLASITLSYDRGARVNGDYECAEDERILRVNKNRLFGRVYKKGWVCGFDERSKRIFIDGAEVDREYSAFPKTETNGDGFVDIEQMELPWG